MSRKRWLKGLLAGLLALGNTAGCKQQIFMEPQDYQAAVLSGLPKGLETNTAEIITPGNPQVVKTPATVLDPDRTPRYLSLKECIALALEQGNVGFQTPTALGTKLEILPSFTGATVTGTDSIRAFAIDPATMANELERSLSKFDVQWINSLTWQKVDNPVAAQFLTFSSQYDSASLSSTLVKPLPTGGVAAITFDTSYTKYAQPNTTIGNFVNPNYVPQVQLTFEQPLLKQFGVDINELAPSHPGSQLLNIQPSGGVNTQGILLQRIHLDQQKADFEIRINYMMANVELAYWNLFAAYYNLYGNEEGLREAYLGYRFTSTRVEVGSDPSQNRDQARAQFERFRRQVYDARGTVLESERQLRGLLGLRSDDGTRLVPVDEPNLVPYVPDFQEAVNDAMAHRPELLQCRQDLKVQQLNIILQKNLRQPDLRFVSQYSIQGLGTRLDGSDMLSPAIPGNALAQMASDQYQNWLLGLRMTMPLGFRDANAFVREAQLSLARSYYQLRDTELKVMEYLVQSYRQMVQTHADIGPARAERQALQIYIAKIDTLIQIGKWNPQDFLNYLTVQQQLAAAIATEYQAIANYNNALATFEFAKGTIQQYNNVSIGEGPLPAWAQEKAADHFKRRDAAIKVRERDTSEWTTTNPLPIGPAVGTPFTQDLPPFAEKKWEEVPKSPDQSVPAAPMPTPTPPGPLPKPATQPSGPVVFSPQGEPAARPAMPQSEPVAPATIAPAPTSPTVPATQSISVPALPATTSTTPTVSWPASSRPAMAPSSSATIPTPPTGASASAPAASGDIYFRPVGTASLPSRGAEITGPQSNGPDGVFRSAQPGGQLQSAPGGGASNVPLPAGPGLAPLAIPSASLPVPSSSTHSLPVPGSSSLPVPPSASTGTVEFGPAGSVAPLGSR